MNDKNYELNIGEWKKWKNKCYAIAGMWRLLVFVAYMPDLRQTRWTAGASTFLDHRWKPIPCPFTIKFNKKREKKKRKTKKKSEAKQSPRGKSLARRLFFHDCLSRNDIGRWPETGSFWICRQTLLRLIYFYSSPKHTRRTISQGQRLWYSNSVQLIIFIIRHAKKESNKILFLFLLSYSCFYSEKNNNFLSHFNEFFSSHLILYYYKIVIVKIVNCKNCNFKWQIKLEEK